KNGIINPVIPSLMDVIDTLLGETPAIPDAAYDERATGGVILDRDAKRNANICATIGDTPNSTNNGAETVATIIYAIVASIPIPRMILMIIVKNPAKNKLSPAR